MYPEFTLRPARAEDRDFVFATYEAALRPYVEWAWGWNEGFQRQGIGRRLVMAEILRARGNGKPLHLKVIKINPARRLYERLGFEVAGEDKATCLMRVA